MQYVAARNDPPKGAWRTRSLEFLKRLVGLPCEAGSAMAVRNVSHER